MAQTFKLGDVISFSVEYTVKNLIQDVEVETILEYLDKPEDEITEEDVQAYFEKNCYAQPFIPGCEYMEFSNIKVKDIQ